MRANEAAKCSLCCNSNYRNCQEECSCMNSASKNKIITARSKKSIIAPFKFPPKNSTCSTEFILRNLGICLGVVTLIHLSKDMHVIINCFIIFFVIPSSCNFNQRTFSKTVSKFSYFNRIVDLCNNFLQSVLKCRYFI